MGSAWVRSGRPLQSYFADRWQSLAGAGARTSASLDNELARAARAPRGRLLQRRISKTYGATRWQSLAAVGRWGKLAARLAEEALGNSRANRWQVLATSAGTVLATERGLRVVRVFVAVLELATATVEYVVHIHAGAGGG